MPQDTRIALFLMGELVAALRANDPDAFRQWLSGGVHDQLQRGMDSHDVQHLIVHVATSLQRIALKAEEDKQYAAAVGAQKMLYELLLRRKMDNEAAKASRPGWGYRHGNTRS